MTKPYPDTHHDVSSNTIFGFWVYLMTDVVLFATFFATYAVLRDGTHDLFDLPFALGATLVLLTSSFACGIAMKVAPQIGKMLFWFVLTFLFGGGFVGMECSEFNRMIGGGNTWQSSAFLSSYFTLIGVHALHVVVGLLMMLVFLFQLIQKGLTERVLRRLTCLKMYWHFLYLMWIFTFAIVYLIGAK